MYNDLLPGESYIIKHKDLTKENKESTYAVYFTQEKKFFDYIKDKYDYIKCFSFIPFALSSYNIPFGLAGDEALKHFVKIVREKLRKSDYNIFRIGGV